MRIIIPLLAFLCVPAVAQEPPAKPDLEKINQLFFRQYDGNLDGQVTRREFLTPSMAQFEYLDRNADGIVDWSEVAAFTKMMTEQRAAKPQQPQQPQN